MQTNFPEPKYYLCSLTTTAARNLVTFYNQVLAPLGLTAQQAMALGVLWNEEEISLGVFARRAGIGKAAAVSMIKRLEAMDLVIREPHPGDARLNVLKLTDKARKLGPRVVRIVDDLEKAIEAALGFKNLQTLVAGLSVIRNLEL
jgi:DNA-binding MarR family transcriptional regulator